MSAYPKSDHDFKEFRIEKVEAGSGGWSVTFDGCMGFFIPANGRVVPTVGMIMRQYPGRLGTSQRGLFLDGVQIYYRTPDEEKIFRDQEFYGCDAAEWLARWDEGRSVHSIEMGGLGPGYEQALQMAAAEILRHMLEQKYDTRLWHDEDVLKADNAAIRAWSYTSKRIDALSLSGAQFGAAMNLAVMLYRNGPIAVMNDPRVKDRHIQISRHFPSLEGIPA